MKHIHFLSTRDRITDFAWYPIRYNRGRLRELGYRCSIGYDAAPRSLSCDILCVNSKYFRRKWHEPATVFSFLREARRYAATIIWFDDSDSTGVTHFEVLPLVDLYLKKQLLKDRHLYARKFYGDRIFTDFYHRTFQVEDEGVIYHSQPIDPALLPKVDLSWHIGLGDMAGDILPYPLLRRYLPASYGVKFTPPDGERPLDVMSRGSVFYGRNTIRFHREQIRSRLEEMKDINLAAAGRVSIAKYKKESSLAKLIVSPFGWGELGVRDFEASLHGAALVKPDMSHMDTWPDIFVPGETYEPLAWDFSDLAGKIRALLADTPRRIELARNGQDAYRAMISAKGMEDFCLWFDSRMKMAEARKEHG
ncbi:MAG: glycosyltransferase family 1 protein [Deltaproteobacteria bacterium]|nr:glycosyltransferase family 1 protein [Deltaproteobacteria bacterium]